MKKALKKILIAVAAVLLVIIAAAPFAVPAAAEYFISAKLSEFGLFPDVRMSFGYCWRNGPGVSGTLDVALLDSPWRARAEFGASCSEWSVSVKVPETEFSSDDSVLKSVLERYPPEGVSNLVFSGSVALDAKAERTFKTPVPVWDVKVPLRNVDAAMMSGKNEITVEGLSAVPGVSGIADRLFIAPLFPRADLITAAGFTLTNFFASIRATERSLIVNEASAGFCNGRLSVYSLFLDPATLNTGFTLFLENIDAGHALKNFKCFRGDASGRLHGKMRMFIRESGSAVRLSDAFLYSTPGETGKLQMRNPELVTDNLALAGLDEKTRKNVAYALTDLDYSALKLDLKRPAGGSATLTFHVAGSATRGEQTVPVNLTVNFHGELEQMINIGLDYNTRLKRLKGKMKK
ncbi:MAG: YdbH domain-containing protein [Kiritimatiellae bacterium]|nr:YdbH domain-containing protein [Kiritimatiellia bacterium]